MVHFRRGHWHGAALLSAMLLGLMMTSSCSIIKDRNEKVDKAEKEDRFAFLKRKQEKDKKLTQKQKKETIENSAAEQVTPEKVDKPVVSEEQLKKLGTPEKKKPTMEDLTKPQPKFYEEFIALNGDEEVNVSLVFNSAPLLDVLSAFGDILGFNFVADNDLKGNVTLNINSKMTRRELWNTFDRMVYLSGAAVRVEGSLIRVMALQKVAMQPDNRSGKADTEIYYRPLINAQANEVVRQIRTFLGNGAGCIELTRPNAILICDTSENMAKLRELIEYIDKNGKDGWPRMVIPCNNVLPNKLAIELQEVLPVLGLNIYKTTDRTPAPGAVQIVGIDRMRLMVISAATDEVLKVIREWVTLLDNAGSEDQENVFVYKVRHNKAVHLARALAVVFETQGSALTTDAATGKTRLETINSPVTRTVRSTLGRTNTRSSAVNVGTAAETDQESKVYASVVKVFADGVLNRLVVRCTPRTYASVKALLDKLDVVPAQVLLQVMMAEVQLTESTQFGLEFSGTGSANGNDISFGTNYAGAGTNSLNPFITDSETGSVRVRQGSERQSGGTFVITDPDDPQKKFGYIRAQAGNGLVKVIACPQLLVSSQTQATLQIGQDVPIITSGVTNSSSSGNVTQSYEYKNTGVMLTLTPYVTSTDLITLEIEQTHSKATSNTITPTINSPVINIAKMSTSMTIANGQTMVIGGMIKEDTDDDLQSLPVINQIPFLKRLLGSTNASVTRAEYLVMITGYIVNEHSEVDELIRRYNDAIKAFNQFDKTLGDNPQSEKHRGLLMQNQEFWK